MVILDIAIVNVALPSIQVDLGFSQESLQWVISAYALVFGGFLLLGGRAADLLGRRRVFIGGLIIFTIGVAALRPRVERDGADRRQGDPGPRSRCRLSRSPVDSHDDLPRRPRPQHRPRCLGRRGRLRRGGGRAARRPAHRRSVVGVDLLRERPRRAHRSGGRPRAAQREPRRSGEALRRAGRGARDRRPLAPRVHDHPGARASAGARGRRSPCSPARSGCWPRSRRGRSALPTRSCRSRSSRSGRSRDRTAPAS